MRQYLDLLSKIHREGDDRLDRTKVGTRALFGLNFRHALHGGRSFPLLTTKAINFELIKAELLWMISGSSDVRDLQKLGCHIWDANANADYWKPKAKFEGDLGRVYGVQWRHWRCADNQSREVDQLSDVIERIKNNPYDRRLLVTAWNPGELDQMALPPCHMFFQFFVAQGELSVHMYQRSCDMFLGVPFNIAFYALLLCMVAQVTKLLPHELVITFGDVHIYQNHFEQVKKQLERSPLALPALRLNPEVTAIDDFQMEDIILQNYESYPAIKAPMAV